MEKLCLSGQWDSYIIQCYITHKVVTYSYRFSSGGCPSILGIPACCAGEYYQYRKVSTMCIWTHRTLTSSSSIESYIIYGCNSVIL